MTTGDYHLLNGLLQRRKSPCLPANDNMHDLAASFSNFFCAKIDTIRVALRTQSTLTSSTLTDQHPTPTLTGATYSVSTHLLHDHRPTSNTYTHWRYVLSVHSPPPRSQTNIQHLHSLALRTQCPLTSSTLTDQHPTPTLTGTTYSVSTHLLHAHRPTSNTLRVTTSLTSGCNNIRHLQPAQQVANNIVRARSFTNIIPVLMKANLDHNNMNCYRPI